MAAGDLFLNLILKASNQTGSAIGDVSRELNGMAGPIGAVVTGATVAGAAMAGLAAVSLKAAGDLQQGITQIVTTAGEDANNIKLITEGVKNLAVETATPIDNLVKGLYMVESGTFHGADALKILKIAAQGAKSENADLNVVARALTATMNDYGIKASGAAGVMNALITTVSMGQTKLQDLGLAMGNMLPIAASLHVAFPQVAGALAIMTNAGMTAQRASMDIAFALRNLAAPGGVATKTLASVGITAEQLHKVLTTQGLDAALKMIEEHLYKKFPQGSAAAVTAYKAIMGGQAGYQVALEIGGEKMKAYEENIRKIDEALKKGGGSVENWELVQSNFNFKIDQAKESIQVLLITIGQALIPAAGRLVDIATKIIQNFTQWEQKTHIVQTGVTLLGQGLSKLVEFVNNVISKGTQFVETFKKSELAMSTLKGIIVAAVAILVIAFAQWAIAAGAAAIATIAAAAPLIALGAAIAILSAVFIHFYQTSPQFKAFIDGFVKGLQQAWTVIQQNFLPVLQKIGQFISTYVWPILVMLGKYIGDQFSQVWKDLVDVFNTELKPAWEQMVKALGPAMPAFKVIGEVILGVVVAAIVILAALIVGIVKAFAGFLSGVISFAGGVAEAMSGLVTMISGGMALIKDIFTGQWGKIGGDLKVMWGGFVTFWKGVWDAFVGILRIFWYTISGLFTGIFDTIVNVFKKIYDDLVGHSIIPDIVNGAFLWFNKLPGFFTTLLKNILNFFIQQWTNIANAVKTAWTTISTIIGQAWTVYVQPKLTMLMTQLTNWGKNLQTLFGTWATNAMDMFAKMIKGAIPNVQNAITNVAQTIKDFLGIKSPTAKGPLSTSDKWMPNMMTMFANGINQNSGKVTTATSNLALRISTSFNQINANVASSINSINSKIMLLATNIATQSGKVTTQFKALDTSVQTSTTQIGSKIQLLSDKAPAAFSLITSSAQQTGTDIVAVSQNISQSADQSAQNVEKSGSSMHVVFGNTSKYSSQTVTVVDQNTQEIAKQLDRIKGKNETITKDIVKGLKDVLEGDGIGAAKHFLDAVTQFGAAAVAQAKADAAAIANMLGHTKPKEGPLRDDDQWGKHMIENIVGGMVDQVPLLTKTTDNIAEILGTIGIGPKGKLTNKLASSVALNINPSGAQNQPMIIYMQIDKKTVGKVVTNYQQRELRVQGAIRGV